MNQEQKKKFKRQRS